MNRFTSRRVVALVALTWTVAAMHSRSQTPYAELPSYPPLNSNFNCQNGNLLEALEYLGINGTSIVDNRPLPIMFPTGPEAGYRECNPGWISAIGLQSGVQRVGTPIVVAASGNSLSFTIDLGYDSPFTISSAATVFLDTNASYSFDAAPVDERRGLCPPSAALPRAIRGRIFRHQGTVSFTSGFPGGGWPSSTWMRVTIYPSGLPCDLAPHAGGVVWHAWTVEIPVHISSGAAPAWATNTTRASLAFGHVVATPFVPAVYTGFVGTTVDLNFFTDLSNATGILAVTRAAPITFAQAAFLSGGLPINLDLTDPTLDFPLGAPNPVSVASLYGQLSLTVTGAWSIQGGVIHPSLASGFAITQASRIVVLP